jgi:hypothetical protein
MRQLVDIPGGSHGPPFGVPSFQGKIMRDPKEPTMQIGARLVLLQV